MKHSLLALLAVAALNASAQPVSYKQLAPGHTFNAEPAPSGDTWSGKDKIKHVQYSCVFALGAAGVFNKSEWYVQAGAALLPGVLKETHDHYTGDGTGWSWRDMGANALGVAGCLPVGRWLFQVEPGRVQVTARWEWK